MKAIAIVAAALLAIPVVVLLSIILMFGALVGKSGSSATPSGSFEPPPSAYAQANIPPHTYTSSHNAGWLVSLPLLVSASEHNGVCTMNWTYLAGVANQESTFGESTAPGVHSGLNSAGIAAGQMQFEPATFVEYDTQQPNYPGSVAATNLGLSNGQVPPANSPIYNSVNAAYAAARALCNNGIDTNAYNALRWYGGAGWYATAVIDQAKKYGGSGTTSGSSVQTAQVMAAFIAAGKTGQTTSPPSAPTLCSWTGGTDCSAMFSAIYQALGIPLPTTVPAQYAYGQTVNTLEPGDLLFFETIPPPKPKNACSTTSTTTTTTTTTTSASTTTTTTPCVKWTQQKPVLTMTAMYFNDNTIIYSTGIGQPVKTTTIPTNPPPTSFTLNGLRYKGATDPAEVKG
jgi:hypothetical protein